MLILGSLGDQDNGKWIPISFKLVNIVNLSRLDAQLNPKRIIPSSYVIQNGQDFIRSSEGQSIFFPFVPFCAKIV